MYKLFSTIVVALLLATATAYTQAQAPSMDALIAAAAKSPSAKPALLKALMNGHVFVIATWKSKDAKDINVQDFMRNGKSFIPIFQDQKHFETETKGSGFEKKGVSIDANMLASIMKGTETLVLNPGSKTPIDIAASELKPLIDKSRLPKAK